MSDSKKPTVQAPEFGVILPCTEEQFSEFISSILSKPQTLESGKEEQFELKKDDIKNLFYLVDQRISQQNEGHLLQFMIKISYDDGSSVMIGSLKEFDHYNEIHPVMPIAVVLSWVYMIKFKNKSTPEKQEIDLTFLVSYRHSKYNYPRYFYSGAEPITLRIHHTARSWGVDIQSLIMNHVQVYFTKDPIWRKRLNDYSDASGFMAGSLMFLSSLVGTYLNTRTFQNANLAKAKALFETLPNTNDSAKLDFLITSAIAGTWPKYILGLVGFIVTSIIISIFAGVSIAGVAKSPTQSFILLTAKAQEEKDKYLKKREHKEVSFILSIFVAIIIGVVSNYIFQWMTKA